MKDQDAEWGYTAGRSGMAIEAKMGMGIVLILVCAFGFLVYHKMDLKRRTTAQLAQTETTDSGAVAKNSDGDSDFFSQTSITDAVAAAGDQLKAATPAVVPTPDTVPTSIRSTIDAGSAEPTIQVAAQTNAQEEPAFAAFNSEPPVAEPAFDLTEPAGNTAPAENSFAALTAQQTPKPTPVTPSRERVEPTFDSPFADFDQAARTPKLSGPDATLEPEPTTAFDSFPTQGTVAAAETDSPGIDPSFNAASPFGATDTVTTETEQAFSKAKPTPVQDAEWGPSQNRPATFDLSEPRQVATRAALQSTESGLPSADGFEAFGNPSGQASESGVVAFDSAAETPESVADLDDPPFGAVSAKQSSESFANAVELPAMADVSESADVPALLLESPGSQVDGRSEQTDSFSPRPVAQPETQTYRFSKDSEPATADAASQDVPFGRGGFESRTFTTGTSSISPQNAAARPRTPVVAGQTPQLSIPTLPRTYESGTGGTARFVAAETIQQVSNTTVQCDICEVQPNDNYWTISRRAYGTARYFSSLALYNQTRIPDPKKLRPGMKVLIPAPELLEQKYPELFQDQQPKVQKPAGFFLQQDGSPAYRVGDRETLSEISQKHLGRASRWIQIYRMNQNILKDPNRLKPGTVIALPNDANDVHLAP